MNLQRIMHSKCPSCGEFGLPILKSGKMFNPSLKCRKCGKRYKVNRAWTFFMMFFAVIFPGLLLIAIKEKYYPVPDWLFSVILILLWLLTEYYAPLDEEK